MVGRVDLCRRPVDLAAELVRAGAEVVVVGGTAHYLRGAAHAPRDLDLAVEPRAVDRLVQALTSLGVQTTSARLLRCGSIHVATAYCPLDLFVGARPASAPLAAAGLVLEVAT